MFDNMLKVAMAQMGIDPEQVKLQMQQAGIEWKAMRAQLDRIEHSLNLVLNGHTANETLPPQIGEEKHE